MSLASRFYQKAPTGGGDITLTPSLEFYVDQNNAASTEDGSIQNPYKTISAAITGAGGSPATIHLTPGTYTEVIFPTAGITLMGANPSDCTETVVFGLCHVSLTASGVFVASGVTFANDSDYAMRNHGSNAQTIVLRNCKVVAEGDSDPAFVDTNTHADTLCIFEDTVFSVDDPLSTAPAYQSPHGASAPPTGALREFTGCEIYAAVVDGPAIEAAGIMAKMSYGKIWGQAIADSSFGRDGAFDMRCMHLITDTVSVLDDTTPVDSFLYNCRLDSSATPTVSGTGSLSYALLEFGVVDGGLDAGLSLSALQVKGAENIQYDPTASGLSATDVQAAIDEVRSLDKNWYVVKLGNNDDDAVTGLRETWVMAAPGEIHGAHGGSASVATGAACVTDVHRNGTTIFSAKVTIDNGDQDSLDAGTQPALAANPTVFAAGDKLEFENDSVPTSGCAGLHTDLLIKWT